MVCGHAAMRSTLTSALVVLVLGLAVALTAILGAVTGIAVLRAAVAAARTLVEGELAESESAE